MISPMHKFCAGRTNYLQLSPEMPKRHQCARILMLFKAHGNGSNSLKREPRKASLDHKRGTADHVDSTDKRCNSWAASASSSMLAAASPALALDEVTFGTNWLAQAEHGGFYQAVADGTYEKYGLKVTIVQGGPQAANRALLIAGKIEFYMGGNHVELDLAVEQGIPIDRRRGDLPEGSAGPHGPSRTRAREVRRSRRSCRRSSSARTASSPASMDEGDYPGFKDEQFKPYTFNPAPFLADKKSAQQGYLTSEPYAIEKQAGFKPKVFLLADDGYRTYSTTIETHEATGRRQPRLVQRFVDASIIGWYNYLYGDNKAANDADQEGQSGDDRRADRLLASPR